MFIQRAQNKINVKQLYALLFCRSPPAAVMSILAATEELVENILGSVQVGEFAVVQPLSMEHCCILGYLLAWKLLLVFFNVSPSQV